MPSYMSTHYHSSEYLTLTMAALEVIWLRDLLAEIGFPQNAPTKIYCDNLSTIHLASNDVVTPRVKHIALRHHFLKEQIASGKIELEHIPSADNIADCMTKPLDGVKFIEFRKQLKMKRVLGL